MGTTVLERNLIQDPQAVFNRASELRDELIEIHGSAWQARQADPEAMEIAEYLQEAAYFAWTGKRPEGSLN